METEFRQNGNEIARLYKAVQRGVQLQNASEILENGSFLLQKAFKDTLSHTRAYPQSEAHIMAVIQIYCYFSGEFSAEDEEYVVGLLRFVQNVQKTAQFEEKFTKILIMLDGVFGGEVQAVV